MTELRRLRRPRGLPTYGPRRRFGPFHRQAVRFVGRTLERAGTALDMWSWGWRNGP